MGDDDTIGARRRIDGVLAEVMPDGSTRALPSTTDGDRLATMTEAEIEAGAASDPDCPP